MDTPTVPPQEVFKGIPVSSGIAIGRAYVLLKPQAEIDRYLITPAEVPTEIARFRRALGKSQTQLRRIKEKLGQELGAEHSYIIDTHLLILKDRMLIDGVMQRIERDLVNAESALEEVLETFKSVFRKLEDEYLRDRHTDVEDVVNRVMMNLAGHREGLRDLPPEAVIIAPDLAPSETAQMDPETVKGFATERGGRTSHTTIMARRLEIPAVVGLPGITRKVVNGTPVIVDGNAGLLVVNPDEPTLRQYRLWREKYRYYEVELLKIKDKPAVTTDGRRVHLMANVELPDEVSSVLEHGGEGVGLYRTEYLYLNRADLPPEEEHYRTYRKLVSALKGRPATIRTLDLGGDKLVEQIPGLREANPALGLRAIRLCLRQTDMFREQLRGILRASHHGKLRIMFPMISGLEELRQAKVVLEEAKEDLRRSGHPFDETVPVGAMIETPAAASIVDLLARESDFFSIGTNDLIQYSLAIDRVNQNVSYLYKPLHPAVLRSVRRIIEAASECRIPVAMCGEMAGEPMYSLILLGLGLDDLSMNATAIPRVKKIIVSTSLEAAGEMARKALELATAEEVEGYINAEMSARFPADVTADGRQICLL